MASYNKVIMMGNMTRDPELSYLPSQTAVVEFDLATTHKYRGADGQDREETCFISCRMFGKRAEVIDKYFGKGNPILVEGRLKLDVWDAPDGRKCYKHRIIVDNFSFVGGNNNGAGEQSGRSAGKGTQAEMYPNDKEQAYDIPAPPADDDIPF